jgi:hypothetical protein
MVMGRGTLNLCFEDCLGLLNIESFAGCFSQLRVDRSIGLGELQEELGSDDESLSGSRLFMPETDLRREFSEPVLFMLLTFPFGEEDVGYMADMIDGRDLCHGIVRPLSLWKLEA